jgi:type IV pilus assembly protein PilC
MTTPIPMRKMLRLFRVRILRSDGAAGERKMTVWALQPIDVQRLVPKSDDEYVDFDEMQAADTALARLFLSKKPKVKDLKDFYSTMSRCLKVDSSLLNALNLTIPGVRHPILSNVLLKVATAIKDGNSSENALKQLEEILPDTHVAMIESGFGSGQLPDVFRRLSSNLDSQYATVRRVKKVLVYPGILSVMGASVLIGVAVFVYPKMAEIYTGFHAKLPWETQIMIDSTTFLNKHWWLMVLFAYGTFAFIKSVPGHMKRPWVQDAICRFKPTRNLVQKMSLSESLKTLNMLMESNISISEALTMAAKATFYHRHIRFWTNLREDIKRGKDTVVAISKYGQLLGDEAPLIISSMRTGANNGKIGQVAGDLASGYSEDVEDALANINQFIEPVVITFFGMLVAALVLSIYMPLISLSKALMPGH